MVANVGVGRYQIFKFEGIYGILKIEVSHGFVVGHVNHEWGKIGKERTGRIIRTDVIYF